MQDFPVQLGQALGEYLALKADIPGTADCKEQQLVLSSEYLPDKQNI